MCEHANDMCLRQHNQKRRVAASFVAQRYQIARVLSPPSAPPPKMNPKIADKRARNVVHCYAFSAKPLKFFFGRHKVSGRRGISVFFFVLARMCEHLLSRRRHAARNSRRDQISGNPQSSSSSSLSDLFRLGGRTGRGRFIDPPLGPDAFSWLAPCLSSSELSCSRFRSTHTENSCFQLRVLLLSLSAL